MSRRNLIDVTAGLEKYHKDSPYLAQVKQELSQRPIEAPVYVKHQFNESNKYEYAEQNNSNHALISTISRGRGIWRYYLLDAWNRFVRSGRYALHSD
jgi:hypothetical protein